MRRGLVVGLCAMVLGGCTGPAINMSANGDFYNLESKSTGALNSSLKTLVTFMCVKDVTNYEEIIVNDEKATCQGRFVVLDKNQAQQTGYMTGVMSAAIQGGAFVGGMYLLGDGIGDSGSRTTNNNDTSSHGGNSNSLSSARSDAYSNSNAAAAASGGAGGNGYGGKGGRGGAGGSVNNGMPMGMD